MSMSFLRQNVAEDTGVSLAVPIETDPVKYGATKRVPYAALSGGG